MAKYSYGSYKALEQNHKVAKRKEKHCAELLTRGRLLESKASSLQPTNIYLGFVKLGLHLEVYTDFVVLEILKPAMRSSFIITHSSAVVLT